MGSLMRIGTVVLVLLMCGCGGQWLRKEPAVRPVSSSAPSTVTAPLPELAREVEPSSSTVLKPDNNEATRSIPPVQIHELDQLFSVYNAVTSMSPAQRRDLLTSSGQRYNDEKTLQSALHYIVLLIHDGSEDQLKRAHRILDAVTARSDASADADLLALARMLHGLLRNNAQANSNGAALAQIVTRREDEIEDLKKQISALKSIEKSLYDRDIGTPVERK